MEAKDTVKTINFKEALKISREAERKFVYEQGFNAGIREVVEWLDMPNCFCQIIWGSEGEPNNTFGVAPEYIREVAKERGTDAFYLKEIHYDEWQAKLKEWGV